LLHSANSNRLVILSEVTNGNEAEGPAVALPAKLPPSVILSEATNGNAAEGPAVAFPAKLPPSVILSEATNGNEAEGPAVAFPAKLPPSVILSEATNGNAAEGPAVALPAKLPPSCHPERSDQRERSRRTRGCLSHQTKKQPSSRAKPAHQIPASPYFNPICPR